VVLPPCDGTKTIAKDGTDLFTGWIDPEFNNCGANDRTSETRVAVLEMVEDADFATMFGSLDKDTSKLCLTQHQILDFVRDHENLLRDGGYATLFLFKSKGKFFVASVAWNDYGSLGVNFRRFGSDGICLAKYGHRVVVPQLA